MAPFRELSDLELDALSDEELLAYIARARALGELEAARLALRILVFGHIENVEWRVRRKVPGDAVDKVVGEAFMSAFLATLSGQSVGEFVSWLNRIVDRRIADFHRSKRLETEPLAEEHAGEDDVRGGLPFEPDETAVVETMVIVDDLRAELSPTHRLVVDLYCIEGYPATEAAGLVNDNQPDLHPPMSENNVHQIARRFRQALRDALGKAPS